LASKPIKRTQSSIKFTISSFHKSGLKTITVLVELASSVSSFELFPRFFLSFVELCFELELALIQRIES
jgi:hypothetical protein